VGKRMLWHPFDACHVEKERLPAGIDNSIRGANRGASGRGAREKAVKGACQTQREGTRGKKGGKRNYPKVKESGQRIPCKTVSNRFWLGFVMWFGIGKGLDNFQLRGGGGLTRRSQ